MSQNIDRNIYEYVETHIGRNRTTSRFLDTHNWMKEREQMTVSYCLSHPSEKLLKYKYIGKAFLKLIKDSIEQS
jgi:hypothetical protein